MIDVNLYSSDSFWVITIAVAIFLLFPLGFAVRDLIVNRKEPNLYKRFERFTGTATITFVFASLFLIGLFSYLSAIVGPFYKAEEVKSAIVEKYDVEVTSMNFESGRLNHSRLNRVDLTFKGENLECYFKPEPSNNSSDVVTLLLRCNTLVDVSIAEK